MNMLKEPQYRSQTDRSIPMEKGKLAFIKSLPSNKWLEWTIFAKQLEGPIYYLQLTAAMKDGAALFSKWLPPQKGIYPTCLKLYKDPAFHEAGPFEEFGRRVAMEDGIQLLIKGIRDKIRYTQLVYLENDTRTAISGMIQYQVFSNEGITAPCLIDFSINVRS
jgi:hypothetical protein